MDKFYELDKDSIDQFYEVFNKKSFPVNVGFKFLGSSKQKKIISIKKMPDEYAFLLEKELMVYINEELMEKFDDVARNILIEQEVDKLSIDIGTGKIKMIKPDLTTFASLVNKYGIEEVSRANQVEILSVQQKEDQESDNLSFNFQIIKQTDSEIIQTFILCMSNKLKIKKL